MHEPMSAEVLQVAAELPNPPARLVRAADAVLEGKFTWADVASGSCAHPLAQALFTAKARTTVWPVLELVAKELDGNEVTAAPQPREPAEQSTMSNPFFDDEDLSYCTYLLEWDY